MLALDWSLTADAGGVAVVLIIALVTGYVGIKRTVKAEVGNVRIEVDKMAGEVSGVAAQVNHVDPGDDEPTLREQVAQNTALTVDTNQRLLALETDLAAATEHAIQARRMAREARESVAASLAEHRLFVTRAEFDAYERGRQAGNGPLPPGRTEG